ncbi:MAG: YesL family protein [Eubacteriales bacterium]|nr:YesL family protein [Eubacteriales bacterium]
MSKFFSVNSGLYKFMSRLWDMLKLNFMWVICSIPIVTMGAATTAAYTITLKMVDEEEGYICGPFWREFKANIKKGSIMGVILIIAIYALYLDFQFFKAVEKYSFAFLAIFVLGVILTFTHFIYAFPLQARYENSIINTMRNSFRISLKYFPKTIFLFIALLIEYIIFYQLSWTLLFFGLLLGPACIILTISGFARQFFRNIERENEIRDEETKIAKAENQNTSY